MSVKRLRETNGHEKLTVSNDDCVGCGDEDAPGSVKGYVEGLDRHG